MTAAPHHVILCNKMVWKLGMSLKHIFVGAIAACLAGCTAPGEAARQRANIPPPPGPRGIVASAPPADSSFYPLRCLPDGPETVCKRDTQ
jgi:hypothetical protein